MEDKKLKFRLKKGKGAVQGITDAAGVTHLPGDIVDLPISYDGEMWLERVDPVPVVTAVPGKVEPVEPAPVEAVPLEAPTRTQKKSKS
jgi:hypothetical protein